MSVVFALGIGVIGHSAYTLAVAPIGYEWLFLAALTLVSGSATVRLPSVPATISISETFVFTSILLFGPAAGTLTVALDSLVISFWLVRRHPEPIRVLFNLAAPALSLWIAANLFYLTAGIQPLVVEPTPISDLIPSLLLTTIVYFLLNSWLTAFAISFERGIHPFPVWKQNFMWLSLNYFGGASLASLLVVYTQDIDLTYLGLIVPLLLVMYLTFKTSMARLEDAKQHLAQMNTLYLSTIETLAMAIDAKDQVTHGHIRRVQIYASGLAKAMGMKTEAEVQAIEAAALLHDMGKLAIPEHILNKPGKLTAAEFEKMKRHASIGAEILSAIDFPYPVVPIVRHHHESWNGSGYPDGISGTDIPLGARVLSVVDCYDALTSDRPYRPELPDEEAIQILRDRSGSMYDPEVVDTFIRIHKVIAPTKEDVSEKRTIGEIMATELEQAERTGNKLAPPETTGSELQLLSDLAAELAPVSTLFQAAETISRHVRKLLPASMCVFYLYEDSSDELVAKHVSGTNWQKVIGTRIPIGLRLSGWVGATRKTIHNSDPALDIGELAGRLQPVLRSCLSTPLSVDARLVGVLTLYARERDAFSDDHRRLFQMMGTLVSQVLLDTSQSTDDVGTTVAQPIG